jgi:hypothetical protein
MNNDLIDALVESGGKLNTLVLRAQEILAAAIEPEGISRDAAFNELLGLLDGPEQREAQAGWQAAVSRQG